MGEINLTTQFKSKVADRYSHGSFTDAWAGKQYDFVGAKTIKIYTVDTVPFTPYTRSGLQRFGELTELGDTVDEMTTTRDEGFNLSVDDGNASEQAMKKRATKIIKAQTDEVMKPMIDKHRLAKWATGAGLTTAETAKLDKKNIMDAIFTGSMKMDNELVPDEGRVLLIRNSLYKECKLADQIQNNQVMGGKALKRGSVGMLDLMDVRPIPDKLFPENVNFIIKHRKATVDPMKLKNFRVLTGQQGIGGYVVDGRVIFDAFVLKARNVGVYTSTYNPGP